LKINRSDKVVSENQTSFDGQAFIGGNADKLFAFLNKNILFYCYILKLRRINAAMTGVFALHQRDFGWV